MRIENPFETMKIRLLNNVMPPSKLVYVCPNCNHTSEDAYVYGCKICGSPIIQTRYI